jgi:hypothetical protein
MKDNLRFISGFLIGLGIMMIFVYFHHCMVYSGDWEIVCDLLQ